MNIESQNFKPAMTKKHMYKDNENYQAQEQNHNVTRRMLMAVLTRSKQQLLNRFKNNPGLLVEMIECSARYLRYLEHIVQMLKLAEARLIAVKDDLYRKKETTTKLLTTPQRLH